MTSPNQELSALIVNRLAELNLIRETSKQNLQAKLASGKTTEEDWKLEVELSPRNESPKNG